MEEKTYLCIDLKSFYASVECVERGLDPLTTNLVVADTGRTEKTICLAVSPSLKAYGISGRSRLYEVVQIIKKVNEERKKKLPCGDFTGESYDDVLLKQDKSLSVSYIVAPPRMAFYIDYSTRIYEIYLQYVAPEDIHVYSVDEVFIDITRYRQLYKQSPRELAMTILRDVHAQTGITATAGIGTNLYLAKIAMDIVAKRSPADENGVRIAELDEQSYRETLWTHRPLTDFWRVGKGLAKKLERAGLRTMGDIARESMTAYGEDRLFDMFGMQAEFLIDHAWGYEPCTMEDIRSYVPETKSIGSGQVLREPYSFEKARMIVRGMSEQLVLDLVEKGFVTKQLVLTVGYDVENLKDGHRYEGEITVDAYGRRVPKSAHGTASLSEKTSSGRVITEAVLALYDRIVDPKLSIRRMNVTAANLTNECEASDEPEALQLDLFTDYGNYHEEEKKKKQSLKKERKIQETVIDIKNKFGKNAILKGINLEEGDTTVERNELIGGHKA